MEILRKGNKLAVITQNGDSYHVSYCQECRTGIANEIETDLLATWTCKTMSSAKRWSKDKLGIARDGMAIKKLVA